MLQRKGPDRPPKLTLIQKLQNGSTFAAERVISSLKLLSLSSSFTSHTSDHELIAIFVAGTVFFPLTNAYDFTAYRFALVVVCLPRPSATDSPARSFQVIGNRLAQVQFYKKEDAHDSAETMEALVHKSSGGDRTTSGNASSQIQYSAMSNMNPPSSLQANPMPQVVLPQPATIAKAAKPIRDSAQFVSRNASSFVRNVHIACAVGRSGFSRSLSRCLHCLQHYLLVSERASSRSVRADFALFVQDGLPQYASRVCSEVDAASEHEHRCV